MLRIVVFLLLAVAAAWGQAATNQFPAQAAVGAGTGLNVAAVAPGRHTLQVAVTGSPTTCTVRLEGSLDGVSFFDLSGAQSCTSATMFHVADRVVLYVRPYVVSLSGGTSPTVRVRYLGAK